MRLLNLIGIQKFIVGHDPDCSYVLLVKAQEVDRFQDDEVLLRNACIICLSNNSIGADSITPMWKKFPSAWWVDMSHNQLLSLEGHYPRALGSLNLSGNALKQSTLSHLTSTHILRLHVTVSDDLNFAGYPTINSMIANVLPNVWVINDDFIASFDRRDGAGVSNESKLPGETSQDIEIPSNNLGDRENKLIRAIQNCPPKGKYSDYFRLEILLEEYLQETCYFNCFVQQIELQNNSSHRRIECMPFVDVYALMMLPHRLRLDLTVVLTTSLMFPVPKQLLRDALLILMAQYISRDDIDQLYELPTFAKTALVCLLRRVSKKELQEWSTIQQYCPKPARIMRLAQQKHMYAENAPAPLDYLDSGGFQFLRPMKEYLEQAIEVTVTDPKLLQAMVPFSELEIEIINKLPDVPTQSSAAAYFKEKAAEQASGKASTAIASYKEWIPFAARHTVLLLTKAPSCPPLTRPQQSKVKQELYFEMLPILRAANMTMNDLDLGFVGPGKDGRLLNARTTTLGPTVKPAAADSQQAKTAGAKSGGSFGKDAVLMGANALPFGTGLPRGAPESTLSWKVQEVPRNYHKAWSVEESKKTGENAAYTDDIESVSVAASQVFLTNSEPLKPAPAKVNQVKSYSDFTISQYEFGAPAPLPRNHSFSVDVSPSKLVLQTASANEEEIEYLMGKLRSPYKSLSTSHSMEHLNRVSGSASPGTLSGSIYVPTTNPTSPDGSQFTHNSATGDVGMTLDGGQSRYSEVPSGVSQIPSLAESEPFGMLTGDEEAPEKAPFRSIRPPSQGLSAPGHPAQGHYTQGTAARPPAALTTRPEHISGALAKPILGFSADANWSNKFLLASPSAVAQANFTVGRTDPANAWNFIEYAPVLVHTPAARLAPEALRELTAAATRRPEAETMGRPSMHALGTAQAQELASAPAAEVTGDSIEDQLEQENLPGEAADPSVHTDDSSFNYRRAPSEGAESQAGAEVGDSSRDVSETGYPDRYEAMRALPARKPTQSFLQRNEDPAVTLMKEMGTVRNVRFLKQQNEKILTRSRSSARAVNGGFDEDSVALSQSQLSQGSQGSFGPSLRDLPSLWELDPADPHPTGDSVQAYATEDTVFLTGVGGAEAENEAENDGAYEAQYESQYEAAFDAEYGAEYEAEARYTDNNYTGAEAEELGIIEDGDETSFPEHAQYYTDGTPTNDSSAYTSRPLTPQENYALPPRHFSETEGVIRGRGPGGGAGFGDTGNPGRTIPIPDYLKVPPLKALLQSVSTLDILKSKANYPNIAVCSQSVEYGNQGINANVGKSWYPLMQKNVYRLSTDALNPDSLFVGTRAAKKATKAKPAGRYKRAPGSLKPIKASALSSSLPATRMQALLHEAVTTEQPFAAKPTQTGVELAPDLSNSAYFKALFQPLDRSKKLSKSASAPRPLPALPKRAASPTTDTSAKSGGYFYEQYIPSAEDITSESSQLGLDNGPNVTDLSLTEFQTSVTSYTAPLLQELKDTIHTMMLSHSATPRGGSAHDSRQASAPLTPPPLDHTPAVNPPIRLPARPLSPAYVMSDEITAPSSPKESLRAMSVAGKKLLTSQSTLPVEDDLSSMISVGSALSQHSALSYQRSAGKDIIKAYNENIHKPNWDEFTDSSSIMGTPKPTTGTPKRSAHTGSRGPERTAAGDGNTGSAGRAVRRTISSQPTSAAVALGVTGSAGTAGAASTAPLSGEALRLAPTVVASTATLPRSTVVGLPQKISTGRLPRHTIAGV